MNTLVTREIIFEGEGLPDLDALTVDAPLTVADFANRIRAKHGFTEALLFVFREDNDEPLIDADLIDDEPGVLHVHHARTIDVIVFFNGSEHTHRFAPSATVERVLRWAISPRAFNLDPTMSAEMGLAIRGTEQPLPRRAHIGRFVRRPSHELKLDLVREIVPNG